MSDRMTVFYLVGCFIMGSVIAALVTPLWLALLCDIPAWFIWTSVIAWLEG